VLKPSGQDKKEALFQTKRKGLQINETNSII